MSYEYSEDALIEDAAEEILLDYQWKVETAWHREVFSRMPDRSDGTLGRIDKTEVILQRYLLAALKTLNPGLPLAAYQEAIEQIKQAEADKKLADINKAKHAMLTQGVEVSYLDDKGALQKKKLAVFNFRETEQNHFLAVRQLEIKGPLYDKRPDIVGFVNGIPLVFFELKAHYTDLRKAYDDNLTDYKGGKNHEGTIPALFYYNAFIILSNGTDSRVGTITSPYKFFLEWKRYEEDDEGEVSLDTMIRGVCEKNRLLDIVENFLLFDGEGDDMAKIMAKNHQFLGVNKVLNQARNIEELQGKLGVFWHTQGSGKSYSMVFMCQKLLRKFGGSYTFLMVVDRSELENQLYDTFSGCGALPQQLPKRGIRAKSREHLRELLADNHRYVFTLIHKFSFDPKKEKEYPLISERPNIIVISDEAHRTQGGTFARNMRFNAIPNASYLGFTGTPLIHDEEEITKNIFGDYISVYDFKKAIDDNATLPLRYQNRGEKLAIENPKLDERMAAIINEEELDADQIAKLKREFARDYPILTAENRLREIARDLVWHFNERGYQGKAMFVALDKPTAVRMYDLIMACWPDYVHELEQRLNNAEDEQQAQKLKRHLQWVRETEVCVVVSPEQNELKKFAELGLDIRPHRQKMVERDLETEFKDDANPFRLAIVCAMWITGFDAPCVSTVYLDKPIHGHTLMQTIARANRVYDDEKENGLIIDYGNVYQQLEKAYSVYGDGGNGKQKTNGGQTGGENDPNVVEKLEGMASELSAAIVAVREYLQEVGFELDKLIHAETALKKLAALKAAANAVSLNETTRTQYEFAARNVFRKYNALYPDPLVKPYTPAFNAIEAIYGQLNQKTQSADISGVMRRLQQEVNMSVGILPEGVQEIDAQEDDFVDLSKLDFDKLRAAFAKSGQKNTVVFDLQQAIDQRLTQMLQQNPTRLAFYEKYQKIIKAYNEGKDLQAVQKTFNDLSDFIQNDLDPEVERATREQLDEETLAIFDLLKKPNLTKTEREQVKTVASGLLETLKAEKLRIERWSESPQVSAQVKIIIDERLQWLPAESYPDEEVDTRSTAVYQHVHSRYQGGGMSNYGAV
ncbi:type I restriction endonuclease subunit R [Candidatus Thiothrix sp. Deng01]|uniref:Type I restriction enzyme endonuclease subunit n=1 Tax=Candidatus Thiothrix phosphatis TaxID=3112415 RepID=A0ABU6CYB7_9GAMM|nr:type I restriction endonuclease subunit R [Candidatus Thiothrix sp. Deng01]MEB4591837.1 type I restriction endonuclease subunit R [Candidatus Thiothrix sp. Deng01]